MLLSESYLYRVYRQAWYSHTKCHDCRCKVHWYPCKVRTTTSTLLNFIEELCWPSHKEIRDAANVVQMFPFSSDRKTMDVVVELENSSHRLYIKGASKILTKLCIRHVIGSPDANQASDEDATVEIGVYAEINVSHTIIFYTNQSVTRDVLL